VTGQNEQDDNNNNERKNEGQQMRRAAEVVHPPLLHKVCFSLCFSDYNDHAGEGYASAFPWCIPAYNNDGVCAYAPTYLQTQVYTNHAYKPIPTHVSCTSPGLPTHQRLPASQVYTSAYLVHRCCLSIDEHALSRGIWVVT
jgi:hypothetical protein